MPPQQKGSQDFPFDTECCTMRWESENVHTYDHQVIVRAAAWDMAGNLRRMQRTQEEILRVLKRMDRRAAWRAR